jgi:hypothetical protein
VANSIYDPERGNFSASLRKGSLYVKMPLKKALGLVQALELAGFLTGDVEDPNPAAEFQDFLAGEYRRATNQSLFYAVDVEGARKDIESLMLVEPQDESGLIRTFCDCLEAGLRNDPGVDWIGRVGGPKPDAAPEDPRRAEPRPQNPNLLGIELF